MRDGGKTSRITAGFGDLVHKTPMRADNHFKIASLTKTYTATVVLQLIQQGKLRLGDNVERWLPKKQKRNPSVTEIVKMPRRGHALTIDHGWREVAETALEFVRRFA